MNAGMTEDHIGRWLFQEDGLVPGYLRAVDDTIEEVCFGTPPSDSARSVILPAFVNAHTHIGDAFAHPAPKGTVEDTVGPGGYKHRMLDSAGTVEKIAGMKASIDLMSRTGTGIFADFREEGADGANALHRVLAGRHIRGVVLGRPVSAENVKDEVQDLLRTCDGIAFSAVSDWPLEVLEATSRICRQSGKLFSLHASEVRRERIDDILSLKPDFVVHMTAAAEEDLVECARAGVPVVVCPTSNAFFNLYPDIPRLLDLGVTVALGTDNAMICRPDMLSEMRAAYALSRRFGGISAMDAISLATLSGRKVLNAEGQITTEMSVSDDLVAVDVEGEDPLLGLVSAAATAGVSAVAHRGKLRRPTLG
ncbi:MAG: amidohydrolase family protein [Methanobacteriota archaeon]|nr:MAG: amidohydrolase family protein [Euryarchaeota archaeon]